MLALESLEGIVVIDEVQLRPDLFPVLRVLSDRTPTPARFLILGSAAPQALRQASESLTGRIETIELGGLSVAEVGGGDETVLWRRGGYPASFLATSEPNSVAWRQSYVRNLAPRDLPPFGVSLPAATIERFLRTLAHSHGQLLNRARLARTLQVSERTIGRYGNALQDALLVRLLPPWHSNYGKRLIRTPKLYFRDSGLVRTLLDVHDHAALLRHPAYGATWEGFAIEELLRHTQAGPSATFWATSGGAEIDLLVRQPDGLVGVEVKRADAPRLTRSLVTASADLGLERVLVIYPGNSTYALRADIHVVPLRDMHTHLQPWP